MPFMFSGDRSTWNGPYDSAETAAVMGRAHYGHTPFYTGELIGYKRLPKVTRISLQMPPEEFSFSLDGLRWAHGGYKHRDDALAAARALSANESCAYTAVMEPVTMGSAIKPTAAWDMFRDLIHRLERELGVEAVRKLRAFPEQRLARLQKLLERQWDEFQQDEGLHIHDWRPGRIVEHSLRPAPSIYRRALALIGAS